MRIIYLLFTKHILEMYGPDVEKPNSFAANCLMARRLVERGVRFVQLFHMGWDHHLIETQLAHIAQSSVSAAYNFAQYLDRRREMMQAWADHLDTLKNGATK